MKIDLENKTNYQLDEARLISLADFSLTKLGIHPDSELGIRLVNEIEMEELHQKWMNLSGATDVMSFPMDEIKPDSASNGPGIIGDIVLCPEFAAKNGKQSTDLEIELLTVHGVLHLLGFDHEEIEDELVMFKMQEDFLNQWRALK
ncbi:MAG: rRNA maturation RNase YbeY [Actinobacteria bacterium BACL4 MAG-120820-bin23]|jgi:probable rRNA maturation factor|uniref:rRNA maturation RNase YbeY n=1 Tax=Candidatus Nanopelagicus sp. TaxID=2518620 RepID=UPI0007129508|nr:MAG: rRNA maturation RNase YbeY [Actinobacteria bacterium BACL4 MAG-120820-bin23]KRO77376.1 MAG: rRNA maturation RNase YbeY [Actinobacteria bacterium BACL4 MAG-120920-bin74]KRO91454.1 MAG: rRNA maturation RNase YbeY [Actinobacteria bacterium BACL4 MAG-120507-bin0]MDA2965119.1 rRNA maturation RNase YbeY [Actinomycetota bacterium]KRO91841.1 MAG: rRNA maturation RNase YbeY [Actinobacteria bacterium BACL4 MAG-120507-bin0]